MNAKDRVAAIAARHKTRYDFDPREVMPLCTAFIDDMRDHFGAPAGILAEEAGKVVKWGRQLPAAGWVVPVLAVTK